MKKLKIVLLAAVVCAAAFVSRADYLWTWHGDQNYFQASFQVTDPEMLPNSHFTSALFTNSISVSSLDGIAYHATNGDGLAVGGFGPPLSLTLILFDEATTSRLSVRVVPGQVSFIDEFSPLPGGQNGENGFWTYDRIVPEPSTGALIGLGLVALIVKRKSGAKRRAALP
jgi:PEP-CTERM motif